MGAFSIWHWLIVLLVLVAIFGLPLLAIIMEKTDKRTKRLPFLYWLLGYYGLSFILNLVNVDSTVGVSLMAIVGLVMFVLLYPFMQQYVRRARDAGMGKVIAYLSIIPFVNIITTLILLFKVSAEVQDIQSEA